MAGSPAQFSRSGDYTQEARPVISQGPRGSGRDCMKPEPRPSSETHEPPRTGGSDGPPASWDSHAFFLARLLERTTQPFALVGFDGRIIRVNRAFAELLGYEAEELHGLTLAHITPKPWLEANA